MRAEHVMTQSHNGFNIPIYVFMTRQKGESLWIISGIHGEEPAGPNAIADSIDILGSLSKNMPMVIFPLCNPFGYINNKRYPNFVSEDIGKSVSDSEHILLNENNLPRSNKAINFDAFRLTSKAVVISRTHKPKIVIDCHEDDDDPCGEGRYGNYIYTQGKLGLYDPLANKIIKVLNPDYMHLEGTTRSGERYERGMIAPVHDGSIDEMLAAERIMFRKKLQAGPAAESVIVIETNSCDVGLDERVNDQKKVLRLVADVVPHVLMIR